jgi:hypothetical protein
MGNALDLGPVATRGSAFRARAEARQREYRTEVLGVGWSRYGHILDEQAAAAGRNFILSQSHHAARDRASRGKGVADRTFNNMLSSQAMCFNVFAPLADDLDLAYEVLQPFLPGLRAVHNINFEYTPPNDVFGDQTGLGGVDCDLLVEAELQDGAGAVVTIETKFVEPEFSICGFRRPGRKAKGQPVCPDGVPVRANPRACLYEFRKGYRYWEQTLRLRTLAPGALPEVSCPFGGPEWQLWVNHTLAHAEAERRGANHAVFAVCAPTANHALLGAGVLDSFLARLARPETFRFIPLEGLIAQIETAVARREAQLRPWGAGLTRRYAGI